MSKISHSIVGFTNFINESKIKIKSDGSIHETAFKDAINLYFDNDLKTHGIRYQLKKGILFITCRGFNKLKSLPNEANATFDGAVFSLLNINGFLMIKPNGAPMKRVKLCESFEELEDSLKIPHYVYPIVDGTMVIVGILKNGETQVSTRSELPVDPDDLGKHTKILYDSCLAETVEKMRRLKNFGYFTFILSHYKRHSTLKEGEYYPTFVRTTNNDIDPSIEIRKYQPIEVSDEELLSFAKSENKESLGYIIRFQNSPLGLLLEGSFIEHRTFKYEPLINHYNKPEREIIVHRKIGKLFLETLNKEEIINKYPRNKDVFMDILKQIFFFIKYQNFIDSFNELYQANETEVTLELKRSFIHLCNLIAQMKSIQDPIKILDSIQKENEIQSYIELISKFQDIISQNFIYINSISEFPNLDYKKYKDYESRKLQDEILSLLNSPILQKSK